MSSLLLLEKDKVQKKWKDYTRVHGVYELFFHPDELITYWNSDTWVQGGADVRLSLDTSAIFKSLSIGNITLDPNGEICMVGRFIKVGKTVFFEPSKEKR